MHGRQHQRRDTEPAAGSTGVEEQGMRMKASREPRETRLCPATAPVAPSEGNEARSDAQSGVGTSHSSEEAGEPTQRDPVER